MRKILLHCLLYVCFFQAPAAWAEVSASPGNFFFIVASDIHVDRIQQVEGREAARKLAWRVGAELSWDSVLALVEQHKAKASLPTDADSGQLAFAFFNGDVTDCALPGEWQGLEKGFLSGALPIFLGLGNHDYAGQPKRCLRMAKKLGAEHLLAAGSLERMASLARAYADRAGVKNFSLDLQVTTGEWRGSLAYSFDYSGVHFVELQEAPVYAADLNAGERSYHILASIPWLAHDLAQASARGLPSIINLHDLDYLANAEVDRILAQYPPAAIFCGHSHRVQQGYYVALKKKIPVFDSGVFYRGYYFLVELSPRGIKVNYVRGSSGRPVIYKSQMLPWQNAFADK